MSKALITGITGQDGSYLAELLLSKGYEVHGVVRRSSVDNLYRIEHLLDKIKIHSGDLSDPVGLRNIIQKVMPDEIYHEADQDHIGWSYDVPNYSYDITGTAPGKIFEIVRTTCPKAKVFQPLSITMFADRSAPQKIGMDFNPQSPYSCGKVLAYYLAKYYREQFGIFISTATFTTHESERIGKDYLLQKIIRQAKLVKEGKQDAINMSNLDFRVDIGYAPEFMEMAWQIMQLEEPGDYTVGTGEWHTVGEYIKEVCEQVGIPFKVLDNDDYNPPFKPTEYKADTEKINKDLGWIPKITFKELIKKLL